MLAIDGLSVRYETARGSVHALDDVSFEIPAGGALGLVGESGSGKSTVALALLDLLGPEASVSARTFSFDGEDLLDPVLARALTPDLEHRLQSAASLAAELRSVGAVLDVRGGETVHAPDLIPLDDTPDRHASWLLTSAIVVAALAAAAVWWWLAR